MLFTQYSALALAALASGVSANLKIRNHCGADAIVVQSHAGGCNTGANGKCGSAGWVIKKEGTLEMKYNLGGVGTSVKISKRGASGILQFEYNVSGGLWWDLSDLDGRGAGLVGTPYAKDNVKVTPTGKGAGTGTCVPIRCKANQVCLDSYQHPDDPNTKFCPSGTGHIWVDLCMPSDRMNKRDVSEPESFQIGDAEDFQVEGFDDFEVEESQDFEDIEVVESRDSQDFAVFESDESVEVEETEEPEAEVPEPETETLVARAFMA